MHLRVYAEITFACVCVHAPVAHRSLSDLNGAELLYAASAVTGHVGIGDVEALALVPARAAGGEAVRRGRQRRRARHRRLHCGNLHTARLICLLVHELMILGEETN